MNPEHWTWWRDEWGEPDERVRERARADLALEYDINNVFRTLTFKAAINKARKHTDDEHTGPLDECSACMKSAYDAVLAALDSAT